MHTGSGRGLRDRAEEHQGRPGAGWKKGLRLQRGGKGGMDGTSHRASSPPSARERIEGAKADSLEFWLQIYVQVRIFEVASGWRLEGPSEIP